MTVAVITGAAGGIGAGLAREAIRRGMQVVLADRDATALAALADSIGHGATAVTTDVTDPAACEALAASVWATHGGADLLFNNAGVLSTGRCWELSPEVWRRSLAVNVEGIVNCLRAFVPRLLARGQPAHIVNTASVGGFLPSPLMAPYCASKFAVVSLTESLAGELQAMGASIRVSLLAPGPVKSGIFREAPAAASADFHQLMQDMLEAHGLDGDTFAGRVFDAMERGDYWIIPQPETLEPGFSARHQRIVDRLPPQFFLVQDEEQTG